MLCKNVVTKEKLFLNNIILVATYYLNFMKQELIKSGNSMFNAGACLICIVIVTSLIGLIIYTNPNPEKLKIFMMLGAVINGVLLLYAGGSLLRSGKILLHLDDTTKY